jgi:serine/threonine protein kinase
MNEIVAVKEPKSVLSSSELIKAFRREALVMQMLEMKEACVNRLLGININQKHIGLVLEYIVRPDLAKFLEQEESIGVATHHMERRLKYHQLWKALKRPSFKLRVAQDIANGMVHLHSPLFPSLLIHKDLRASNVFLNGDDEKSEKSVAVVGDVGGAALVSRVYKVSNSAELAPEMRFTATWTGYGQEADVYCFGVILWELLSLKFVPDIGMIALFEGRRPDIDEKWNSPEERLLIGVMKKCWEIDPVNRPTFKEIKEMLRNVQK